MRMCNQKCLHYTLFHYLFAKYNSSFFELFSNAFGADSPKKIDNVVINTLLEGFNSVCGEFNAWQKLYFFSQGYSL